jgi:hypothetical protein
MKAGGETEVDTFRRVIGQAIDRVSFECAARETPLQATCLTYLRSEQAWLNKMLQARHVRQPGIIYGFYESPQDELQAYAIERADEKSGFIAVSPYCIGSFGLFFRAALAHRNVLSDFGNTQQELSPDEMGPGHHVFARPRDPERLRILKLLTMMAMRFLMAHEMTHILNGHLRHRFSDQAQVKIAEARNRLSAEDALFNQTLEMDADSGAVVDCMPGVIFAERIPEEPDRIGCHPVFKNPEAALRLWLFAMYGVFRMMEDDATPVPINESSHPSPMMRVQMVVGTLLEFLKREKLHRLIELFPRLFEQTIFDGETAYAAVLNHKLDPGPMHLALSEAAQKRIAAIIGKWRDVRPIVEPFARGGGKLAPLPEDG